MTQAPTFHADTYLPYMRDVAGCEQTLQELNLMWRLIDASARMNCPDEAKTILSTLAATRAGFDALEAALVRTLVQEKVGNVSKAIGTKAQYVIDIVVRNLFERTADIGFLATDGELCNYVAGLEGARSTVENRLQQYRSKYTVYDEIILLDLQGAVLANLDHDSALQCDQPLLAATLGSDGHIETFRASPLRPGKERALIYSRRMHNPQSGVIVGVLCLCFHFEEEMAGIFHSHRDDDNDAVMLLLDGSDRVIASSAPGWIANGATLPTNLQGDAAVRSFCGRQYLVRTCGSAGYQGYPGPPGWLGQVMLPLEIAFSGRPAAALQHLDAALAAGLLSHAETFCPPLHAVMTAVTTASNTIERIVWNGQLLTAGQDGTMQRLKSILDQISETGHRSDALFSSSIQALYQTVLASSMRDAQSTAHLLVDLLDRNLYERSDDCRWWALAGELRSALALPQLEAASLQKIEQVLGTINGLYTVYTRLFVYDRNGVIIASSGDSGTGAGTDSTDSADSVHTEAVVGSSIDADCLSHVLQLRSAQHYHVSGFEPSTLYDGQPTYIYHAALRAPGDEHRVIGGIGIVFDSAPELRNMLVDAIAGRRNMHAFFVHRDGVILSGTDPRHPVGTCLALDAALLQTANGESAVTISVHDGQYAIVASSASCGYREFKISDGYVEDVVAVVIESFGAVLEQVATPPVQDHAVEADLTSIGGTEYATFACGKNLFAIAATCVRQALPHADMLPTAIGARAGRIGLLDLKRDERRRDFAWVFDLAQLTTGRPGVVGPNSQVLVMELGRHTVGLLVDALHAVPSFSAAQIIPMPFALMGSSVLVTQVIKANQGALLLQLIDPERLLALLLEQELPQDEALPMRSAA